MNVLLRLEARARTATPRKSSRWSTRRARSWATTSIGVTPTCVRVPVVNGHSEAVHVQFHRPMTAERAIELLRGAPGVVARRRRVRARAASPQPLAAAGTDPVYVGRVRDDLAVPGAINLWVVADNLRKGAALNAVQIAELLRR